MHSPRLIVIGTSSGGLDALRELAGALPADFPAAIAIVIHSAPQSPGVVHEILARAGALPGISPATGDRLEPGRIYVAPPDHHLIVEPGRLRLTKGPKENRFRPAIDPLFRSAAQVYGPAAIGVILTGNLDDGTAGLWAIKRLGGTTIVQHPADALYPSMPESAVRHVDVDHVVPLRMVAPLLVSLTHRVSEPAAPSEVPRTLADEVRIAAEEDPIAVGVTQMGPPSTFACPECHGVLRQIDEAGRIRFRCHTGHAFSIESLMAEISEGIEVALWNTIRAMQEGALLLQQLGEHAAAAHPETPGGQLTGRAKDLRRQADLLRTMVTSTAVSPSNS